MRRGSRLLAIGRGSAAAQAGFLAGAGRLGGFAGNWNTKFALSRYSVALFVGGVVIVGGITSYSIVIESSLDRNQEPSVYRAIRSAKLKQRKNRGSADVVVVRNILNNNVFCYHCIPPVDEHSKRAKMRVYVNRLIHRVQIFTPVFEDTLYFDLGDLVRSHSLAVNDYSPKSSGVQEAMRISDEGSKGTTTQIVSRPWWSRLTSSAPPVKSTESVAKAETPGPALAASSKGYSLLPDTLLAVELKLRCSQVYHHSLQGNYYMLEGAIEGDVNDCIHRAHLEALNRIRPTTCHPVVYNEMIRSGTANGLGLLSLGDFVGPDQHALVEEIKLAVRRRVQSEGGILNNLTVTVKSPMGKMTFCSEVANCPAVDDTVLPISKSLVEGI